MRTTVVILGVLLFGCDDPLAYPQDIDRLRVLGARVSVEGDASRASPDPGEAVSVEWLVADPDPNPPLGWSFEACPSEAASRGSPECSGPVFAAASSASPAPALPRFDFVTPTDPTERLLLRGRVCRDAVPPGCSGEAVMFEVSVGQPNQNPTLADASFSVNGQPWPDDNGSCALSVPSGEEARLDVTLAESDREPLSEPLGPPREPLLLSHFSTLGRLSRPLSVIEGDASKLDVSVPWRAPGDAAGEQTRFYFVVRDGRGGADWSVRTLCLAP